MNLGPVTHELRTADSLAGTNSQSSSEAAFSARPVSPFPFLNESLLQEDQMYRIENVWASSRALKKIEQKATRKKQKLSLIMNCVPCVN